ncbi:MAG: hypothetical protein LBS19_05920, partial [Clostridiales bacterium]|nr:hypothetical protein [Clostridiales bacterium]
QRAELELENMSQQERLDMLWSALEDYRNRTVTDMEAAQAAFEAIGNAQTDMYRTIEERFNRIEDVSANYNEETGRLEISADILFDRNQDAIKPEYVDRVRQMGEVFFDIIDEYTASGGENMARLEYIEIIGHTDMTSTGSANRGLSQRRAASFIQVFLPDGSSAESEYAKYFKSSGMSKFEPAEGTVTNQTTAQMDANRRVEVRIVFDERDVQRSIAAIADTMSQARDRTDEIFDLPEDGAQMQPPLLPEAGDGR